VLVGVHRDSALGQDGRGQGHDGAVGMCQYLVDDSMASDGGKGRAPWRRDDQVGKLCTALIEQFFGRIAGNDDGLHRDLFSQSSETKLSRSDSTWSTVRLKNFMAILWPDDVLKDQAGVVLEREGWRQLGDKMA